MQKESVAGERIPAQDQIVNKWGEAGINPIWLLLSYLECCDHKHSIFNIFIFKAIGLWPVMGHIHP